VRGVRDDRVHGGVLVSERVPKVGLCLPTFEGWFGGATASWNDLLSLARGAEEMGFDSV
jgi:hypothetical protein